MNSINANTSFNKRASIRLIFLFMRKGSETVVHYSHAPATCGYSSLFLSIYLSRNKQTAQDQEGQTDLMLQNGWRYIDFYDFKNGFVLLSLYYNLFFLSFARIKTDLLCTYAARDGSKTPFYARNMQKLWQIVFKSLWAYELQWSSKFF